MSYASYELGKLEAEVKELKDKARTWAEEVESLRLAGERLRGQYNAAVNDRDRIQGELDGARGLLDMRSRILDEEVGRFKARITCDHPECKLQIGLPIEPGWHELQGILDALRWNEDAHGRHFCPDHITNE